MKLTPKCHCVVVFCLVAAIPVRAAEPRNVTGTYRNYALGFSVEIPKGLVGIAGDEDGPERGVRIALRPGDSITVFGEPNSLEWKSAREGVRYVLTPCRSGHPQPSPVLVGSLHGAQGTCVGDGRLVRVLLAFRPKGEPIYWLRLDTSVNHAEDEQTLERVAASFKVIEWK